MRNVVNRVLEVIFTFQLIIRTFSGSEFVCDDVNATPWTPALSVKRDDLYCPKDCFQNGIIDEECCSCKSCTTWEGKQQNLYVEDLSITGRNIVLSNNQSVESNVYKIHRSHSEMKEFPLNLCKEVIDANLGSLIMSFSNISEYRGRIVQINLEYNDIEEIGDISCLEKLDELNLRYNRISFLSNKTFENLTNLRSLHLQGNRLTKMDPNTLSSSNLHIMIVDVSKNHLSSIDVSNIVLPFQFCNVSFSQNRISEVVNENNFILNENQIYGPGFLNLQDNAVRKFPDLKTLLRITDLNLLGKVWSFGFDLRGVPITCDCSLHPFLSLAIDIIESLWRDYFIVHCTAPEHLNGTSIPDLINDLSQLVCPLDADSGCQTPQCACVDEPHRNTLFIDCSNADLEHFPSIPSSNYSDHISLILSGNNIRYIPDDQYLPKLSFLDLSNNDIHEINNSIARQIEESVLYLRGNNHLLRLPQTFQYRNACSVDIADMILDCDCDSQWIAEWLESKACKTSLFYCNMPGKGKISADLFNVDDLECYKPNIMYIMIIAIICGTTALILASGFVLYIFRYEFLIMYLRIRSMRQEKYRTRPNFFYDVYITLDEKNENILRWTNKYLYSFLITTGYEVFLPFRDITGGSVRHDEAVHAIERSRTVLVILSSDHFQLDDNDRPLTDYEWKYAWNNFRKDRSRNIVLINFDHISSNKINHRQVKAFLRVGTCINFKNNDRDIMHQISVKLGEPQARRDEPQIQMVTPWIGNARFRSSHIERTDTCNSLSLVELDLLQ